MYKFKWNVFLISIFLCGSIAVWGIVSPSGMTGTVKSITAFAIYSLDWFFLLLCTFLVFLAAYLAFGKYSHMKLGKDDDEPEFSLVSWIAMLFASGMGAGLLFWGVAEPVYIYMKPPGIEGQTAQAARYAMVLTNFHWGIHAWSIYAISGAIIAYFLYRKGTPCSLSAPINYTWNWKFSSLISDSRYYCRAFGGFRPCRISRNVPSSA